EGDVTESQLADLQRLMDEVPRIEAALKNFLSLRMAEILAPSLGLRGKEDEGEDEEAEEPASSAQLQGCARVLLRALNALELPASVEWGLRNPQGDSEGGLAFMERLGAYKVVQILWKRCKSAGQKPGKMLGLTALRIALPEVVPQLMSDVKASAAAAGATESQLRRFIE
ncbi:unnamed protein product, partial [Polarella glacialis]